MMKRFLFLSSMLSGVLIGWVTSAPALSDTVEPLVRLKYNHEGLVVDLGVGLWAWPLPIDYDNDGDLDLVVSCPDVPYSGTYFFENPGNPKDGSLPVFKPAVKIGPVLKNVSLSHVDGKPRVLTPAFEVADIRKDVTAGKKIYPRDKFDTTGRVRANQWSYADWDGDGVTDLIVGHGLWADYGWDNAFDKEGNWTRGPLHGVVYWLRNTGSNQEPKYADPEQIQAGGKPVDVYGMPSPNLADFDGDGDLDLLCGEFIDGFTYFENQGSRTEPKLAAGRELAIGDKPLKMPLCMIVVTSIDWDQDGDIDLIVGQEDGRVAYLEHTGKLDNGMPIFQEPVFFQQQADEVKFGALVTPVSVDWDGDGDEDLICGNTAGEIGWIENLDGKDPPKWDRPKLLQADGKPIRILAGPNGSIQGPAEAKWGYTTLDVADWNHDGKLDLVVNSIWGKIVWYEGIDSKTHLEVKTAKPIEVAWEGKPPKPAWNWWDPAEHELATQWRTTPCVVDWNKDGLNDLVMLDHEGYLALFARQRSKESGTGNDSKPGNLILLPGKRVFFHNDGKELLLNGGEAGKSGRRKLCFVDVDADGDLDLLHNGENVLLYRNITKPADAEAGRWMFLDDGRYSKQRLAGHTTSPTAVDWDGNGKPNLLIGAEDGYFYYAPGNEELWVDDFDMVDSHSFMLEGEGYELADFTEGGLAFSNRKYVWKNVPKKFQGWRYTRTAGGETARMRVTATRDRNLYMATAAGQDKVDLKGWTPVEDGVFNYTDAGETKMQIYVREVEFELSEFIPQGNWTGGLMLFPPDHDSKKQKPAKQQPEKRLQPTSSQNSAHRPNVLFLAVDDMRVDLGCYGDKQIKSPNIDALAARGTRFNLAFCQQAVCNPSRASLMTGLRLDTLNIWDLPTHFRERRPDVVTLPQLFKQNGYHTQNIGKIYHNWRQDKYKGDPASWSVPAVMHYNNHGADKPMVDGAVPPNLSKVPRTEMIDVPDEAYFDGRIAALAVEALQEQKDKPFFLAVGFWKPHAHFNAPKKYWDLYDASSISLADPDQPPTDVPSIALHDSREILRGFKSRPGGKPTDEDARTLRHGYYAAISYVDAQIGKVLNELKRLELDKNTVVVFWSDHGYHLGEHSLWAKTSNFELDARVPLIIALPGQAKGQATDSLAELLDLYPTLAELCQLSPPKELEGVSLVPVLRDPAKTVRDFALTQHPRPAYPVEGEEPEAMGYSLRTSDYRYTQWRDFQTGKVLAEELYDHTRDAAETINLAGKDSLATVQETLADKLDEVVGSGRRQTGTTTRPKAE